jgi:hypothetical protein
MNYLIVLQLMAWHSSAGFTFMVTENMVRPRTSIERRKICIKYYNKLSDEIAELYACKKAALGQYWVCSNHRRSVLGHDASIQRLKHKQKVIQRKIDHLGCETERSMKGIAC